MKLAPYLTRLNNSTEYKDFSKKYTDAFMVAGFFIIDYEAGKNIHQFDFFVPKERKIAAFTMDRQITVQLLATMNEKVPEKMDSKTNIDLDELQGILEDEMKNRNITEDIKKVIAILQTLDGKKIWNLNCVLSGMGILRAHVDDASKTVLKMEKVSLTDIMKKLPAQALQNPGMPSKEDMKTEMDRLNKLQEQIEEQKTKIQEEIAKAPKKQDKSSKVTKKPLKKAP
ncbi:MAG TPA: hypothetical protein VJK51_00825 [Candidatus Nanoarchaeia archaeon]|nr:hypothetical protein [Candidatus Nanoarchaeia archaeon]